MTPEFKIEKFERSKHLPFIDDLTSMLHRAYRPLAEKGLKYHATHQGPDVTLRRLEGGESFFGFVNGKLVSTITLVKERKNEHCSWYKRSDVYFFTQFAVDPKFQGGGLGRRLMDFVENYARNDGAIEIALDTSEQAAELISTYKKRNYRFVEHVDWEVTNYRSVVLSKSLSSSF